MKTDLTTSIVAAIAGVIISYFVCNLLIGPIEKFSFKTVEANVNSELGTPDPEIFNYRALNPTVEVYVGNCTNYNEAGECIDGVAASDNSENEAPSGGDEATDNEDEGGL